MALQIRRGLNSQRQSTLFAQGELVYTTDTKDLYIGDGVTSGGTQIAPVKSVNGVTGTVVLTTDQITQGSTNTYYNTNTAKQDAATALIAGNGTNTGITFSYNSSTHVISAVVTNVGGLTSVQGDANPALGGNLSLNSRNITGTGNISITGTISATGLGADLSLNSNNITGTGTIAIKTTTAYPFTASTITAGNQGSLPWIAIQASKGTLASPTTTAAGDLLSGYQIRGYTGSQYVFSSGFYSSWDASAVLSDSQPAANLTFITGAGGASGSSFTFNYKGVLTAPVFQAANYATGSYPTSPAKGWIIFDSTTNHFMGYNGTAWVAFTGP